METGLGDGGCECGINVLGEISDVIGVTEIVYASTYSAVSETGPLALKIKCAQREAVECTPVL